MRKLFVPLFAATMIAAVPAPALAGEVTITISSAGLDLTRAADIATMKQRIDVAVNKACTKATTLSQVGSEAVDECVTDGRAKALAALDAKLAQD